MAAADDTTVAGAVPGEAASRVEPPRSTSERLRATLRRGDEALSPRALRHLLADLQAVAAPQTSDVEGGHRAQAVASWYAQATPEQRRDMWLLMSEQFTPDVARLPSAQRQYEAAVDAAQAAMAELELRRALESPRARLLQRFAAFPQGLRFLLDLRAELLNEVKKDPRLLPLDAELEQLFSTWFDVAFLELRRITWDDPASLLEKLIQYEAVHAIRSWADLKRRLGQDRRCYAFFHPRLPDEPLIFIEVALLDHMAGSIVPLIDESAPVGDPARATTAIFYSISNTQVGLRGVSFGDSLIKRVVETLRTELPRLRAFATLSPIPGLRGWLNKNVQSLLDRLDAKRRAELQTALGDTALQAAAVLAAWERVRELDAVSPWRQWLLACAAYYLTSALPAGKPADPVARFHLGNGARVERINWGGDPSAKGWKQSYGLMVNYWYDLQRIDRHRALLAQGRVAASREVERLWREWLH
ncbi:malonyl-CoA decarboxylase [Extensimonas vulgaris]|uniref:Malonyl-CoA decarboxylase n=1 Tax=Extensimonas vulgaris TaxID=1031594 RepID=A0A369ATK1_9BURK|nr:malonyl-CoA decarboxylase [Extensimonas vulgaris]RCX11586.1 malonyl-CoA decarboxylase [Extensimonas vulgaris]TWI40481.1 malonyl-CoA decarboxylase [Extensimonas vulgaris]TXD16503.1 malonyl-CoA decarboxylase [Extensimonas vulgaris]